ncbi:unnamed protein product [Lampetra fluviatilis]
MDDDGEGEFTVVETRTRKRKARRDAAEKGGGGTWPKRTVATATAVTGGEGSCSGGSSDELHGHRSAIAARGDGTEPQREKEKSRTLQKCSSNTRGSETTPPPPPPDRAREGKTMAESQIGLGSAAKQPDPTETYEAVKENADDAEAVYEVDGTASETSYSSVATEREYAPEEIRSHLEKSYNKRKIVHTETFPDIKGFLKTAQKIVRKPELYAFTKQEVFRLKKIAQTMKNEQLLFQDPPPGSM